MWSPFDASRSRAPSLDDDELWSGVVAHCLLPAEMRRLRYQRVILTSRQYEPEQDRLDEEAGQLELGGIGHVGVQALGTLRSDGVWRWAWGDEAVHPHMRSYAEDLRRYAREERLGGRFTSPEVEALGLLDAAAVGVMFLQADGHHIVRQADGSDLVLMVRHPNLAREPLAYDRLSAVVTRLLATRAVSHPAVLAGWRKYEDGLRFVDREDGALVAEAVALEGFRVGTRWVVERDADGDVVRVGEETADGRAARAPRLRVALGVEGDAESGTFDDPVVGWRAVVSRSAIAAALLQARFEARVLDVAERASSRGWGLDVYEHRLDIEGVGSFEVQALGTQHGDGPWIWAWADTSLPDDLTLASDDLRDEILESPWSTPAADAVTHLVSADDVGMVGARNVGADAYYVVPRPDGGSLVLLLWHELLAMDRLPYERLPFVVMELIAAHELDHRAALAGWRASAPTGLRFVDEADGALTVIADALPPGPDGRLDPAQGHEWRFVLDDAGRITSVRGTAAGPEAAGTGSPPGPVGDGTPPYPWDARRSNAAGEGEGEGEPGMPGGQAWVRAVSRCALAAAINQARFVGEVLHHPDRSPSGNVDYDLDTGQLVVAGVGTFRAEVLGTWDAEGVCTWSSVDPSLPDHVKGLTAELRSTAIAMPYRTPVTSDVTDAAGVLDAALVGAWHCGVDAYYASTAADGSTCVYLLWHPNLSARRLPYELWPTLLFQLLDDLPLHPWLVIDGWRALEPAGLRFSDGPDGVITVTAEDLPTDEDGDPDPVEGAEWRITFDDEGRIAGVDEIRSPGDPRPGDEQT